MSNSTPTDITFNYDSDNMVVHGLPTIDCPSPHLVNPTLPYCISQQSHCLKKTVHYLQEQHGAVHFVDALRMFVDNLPHTDQYLQLNINDQFDCFTNLIIQVPPNELMGDISLTMRVCSHSQCSNGPHKPANPARFDTVLVQIDERLYQYDGFHGMCLSHVYNHIN